MTGSVGRAGPTGVTGFTGLTGATGKQGPTGPASLSILSDTSFSTLNSNMILARYKSKTTNTSLTLADQLLFMEPLTATYLDSSGIKVNGQRYELEDYIGLTGYHGVINLSELTDVSGITPSNNQYLVYNGTKWTSAVYQPTTSLTYKLDNSQLSSSTYNINGKTVSLGGSVSFKLVPDIVNDTSLNMLILRNNNGQMSTRTFIDISTDIVDESVPTSALSVAPAGTSFTICGVSVILGSSVSVSFEQLVNNVNNVSSAVQLYDGYIPMKYDATNGQFITRNPLVCYYYMSGTCRFTQSTNPTGISSLTLQTNFFSDVTGVSFSGTGSGYATGAGYLYVRGVNNNTQSINVRITGRVNVRKGAASTNIFSMRVGLMAYYTLSTSYRSAQELVTTDRITLVPDDYTTFNVSYVLNPNDSKYRNGANNMRGVGLFCVPFNSSNAITFGTSQNSLAGDWMTVSLTITEIS